MDKRSWNRCLPLQNGLLCIVHDKLAEVYSTTDRILNLFN